MYTSTKTMVPNRKYEHEKYIINGKEDNILEFMMSYMMFREIHFQTRKIECLNQLYKKLYNLFNNIDKNNVIQIEKDLILIILSSLVILNTLLQLA